MRMLQYKMELFGQGYTIVGSDIHYENLPGKNCKPIKMTNFMLGEPTSFVENLVDAVYKDWCEEDYKGCFFYENYADILRGKYPEWQLLSFHIVVGYLCLDFYHFATKEHGYLLLGGDQDFSFSVEFEVSDINKASSMKYLVSLSYQITRDRQTRVTEYTDHIRREIDFYFKNPRNNDPFVDNQYIEVTEYADL